MKSVYLTTPIYYVNAKPHLGHAYTTLAVDVMSRYYKAGGRECFFLTGTDEHGTKIQQAAIKNNKDVQTFVDEVAKEFKEAWKVLNIAYDVFARTTDQRHIQSVQKFFQYLYDQGDIYEGYYEGLYCNGCERFMTEKELVEGLCPDHKIAPEFIKEKNYFFKLTKYLPDLKKLIETDQILILPQEKKNEVLGLFKQDLQDFSLSREQVKWGIPAPFDSTQNIYVWSEALTNYISFVGYGDNQTEFQKWWTESKVIQFMSKDILKFHAIFWPALLLSAGLKTPDVIFAHGFFTIDGQKMSKTIGNVINPIDMVQEYGVDATRYLILSQFPFGIDGDIKKEKFTEIYNAKLANNLGNLVSRVLTMCEKYTDAKIPSKADDVLDVEKCWKQFHLHMEHFELFQALKLIDEFTSSCNVYIEEKKPWELAKTNTEELASVLYVLLESLRHIAYFIHSFLPQTSQHILKSIGYSENIQFTESQTSWGQLMPDTPIQKTPPLFSRIQE